MRQKMSRIVSCFALLLAALGSAAGEGGIPLKLVAHTVTLANGKTFSLKLPEGFEISIAAQGLKRIRFMTKAPDGRIFVADMYNRADNKLGTIYILDGFDPRSGKFARVIPWLNHLRNPNNVAFYKDPNGQNWLYVALTDKLERFKFRPGEEAPTAEPEVLASYPDYGLNYKYGGWHLTRTVAFGGSDHGDRTKSRLYVTVGSSCNACEEKEEIRATVSVMDPDGKHQRILGRGLRNAVGMRPVGGKLYATNMGADHLGDDAPDDTMFVLADTAASAGETESDPRKHDGQSSNGQNSNGQNYGWPYCYFKNGIIMADPGFAASPHRLDCSLVPPAYATFAAHSSPLGLEYFDSSTQDAALQDSFLVALHGASKKRLGRGYRVVRIDARKKPEDFITGFLQNGVIYGRPCDLFRMGPDSFLLTDDYSGVIYYVHRK